MRSLVLGLLAAAALGKPPQSARETDPEWMHPQEALARRPFPAEGARLCGNHSFGSDASARVEETPAALASSNFERSQAPGCACL